MDQIRTVKLGGHSFHFQFWQDIEISENPPVFKCNAIIDVALTFDIYVVAGAAHDPSMRERYLASFQRCSVADAVTEIREDALGFALSGLRFGGIVELGPETYREVYLGSAGNDLFVFSYTINREKNPNEDEWRLHLISLVTSTMSQAVANVRPE
jgi:hypothetical protein